MQLFIPPLGTELELIEPWTCEIHNEHRNWTLYEAMTDRGMEPQRRYHEDGSHCEMVKKNEAGDRAYDWETGHGDVRVWFDEYHVFTWPAGTRLRLDRIYVRKGGESFNSLTFFLGDCPDKRFCSKKHKGQISGAVRFWVKLADANKIHCKIIEC